MKIKIWCYTKVNDLFVNELKAIKSILLIVKM